MSRPSQAIESKRVLRFFSWRRTCQCLAAVLMAFAPAMAVEADAPAQSRPTAAVTTLMSLPGFRHDDLRVAFRLFRASCVVLLGKSVSLRAASPPPQELTAVCAAVARQSDRPTRARVLAFFRRYFEPRRIATGAFFTGYYEPVVAGSLVATKAFPTPLYAKPADLVAIVPGATPNLDPTLTAARKTADGHLVAMPDRAAIETGGLGAAARPLVFVASPVEAFFIQVQGSARIRLPDGKLRRLVYAGRNGYPYTSIGKSLVAKLHIPPRDMGLTQLKAWIKDHGQGEGDAGTTLMRENRAFIFFRFNDALPSKAGPIGGEGLSLTPRRSLAIDRTIWPYGLPFYVDTRLPDATPFRHLMISQDTGSAIVGPARADIFFGTGPEAARQAGAIRQGGTLFVLWPKAMPSPSATGAARP